ncbi:uncharacterized protein LOC133843440 [Drosophila sulfurigaster albostrigata]|uniref:uncharacterized protein LOC133843440 n=1 Tax=Drosophila sulfurigaster albostrigata TaxID=89887 RepID=UPI002D21B939|nr:uncharacterized protein LOC133843440 [Drosophila sulfurigaster albostrigata]
MAAFPTTYNKDDNTWSGMQRSLMYNQDMSVGRIIFNIMRNWPKNVCQINDEDGITLTNGQAITWAIRIAQHLKNKGLNSQDVIGILGTNSTYLMPLGVACLMNTTKFHAVNPIADKDTIQYTFGITQPKLIFCDGLHYEKIRSATQEWNPEIITLTGNIKDVPNIESLLEPTTTEKFYQPESIENGDQTVAILCSSGTTGLPKAVCISNSSLIMIDMLTTSESIIYLPSSLDWVTGVWGFLLSTVAGCTRIISNKAFSPEHFVNLVKTYQINYVILPPRHLAALITCPDATPEALSPIKMLSYGGGLVSLTTLKRTQEICKNAVFNSAYAMTEVGVITGNVGIINSTAAGRLMPGIQIRIVDEDGKRLKQNQVGEIFVHTGQTWNGYYGNPVETERMQDSEGWFHTGDLGYFDDKNFLYIVDRKKEVLKYQGLHYWPTEIENVILNLPEVQDVCVVGIYDERQGDAAGALVVKRKGCEISEKAIIDHVAKRLNGLQKQLYAGVCFTDKLPSNHNGKILRKAARDKFVSKK